MTGISYLLPYDFSPLTLLSFILVLVFYGVGLQNMPKETRPGSGRIITFMIGLMLCYGVMQTRFDYYSQYMFFIHRGQHLILHHLGPFLIALSNPLPVIRYWHSQTGEKTRLLFTPVGWLYHTLQQPAIASFLFVGLIYFWLWPVVHFDAMLSRDLYWVMNWSMLLDGLLFWWLIFDSRPPAITKSLSYRWRMFLLAVVAVPQMVLGASIVFSRGMIYDFYEVCGRAWPFPPEMDQLLGGLITWIPPAMMSALGILIILRRTMHEDGKFTTPLPATGGASL
ncbi:MAG TPA: cytochrome c oxidase assembly protein [Marinobacter sp.]|nr:cytochrome c oxidase assembly protein [Marinobacter sp.]